MLSKKGVGLIEILVGVIILGIIITSISSALSNGFYFIKRSEHKAKAMDIAYLEMSRALSRSYDSPLLVDVNNQLVALNADEDDGTDYRLNVRINNDHLHESPPSTNIIPFRNVTVECRYQEKKALGVLSAPKAVRLTNIIPYSYLHTVSLATNAFPVINPPANVPLVPLSANVASNSNPLNYRNIPMERGGNDLEIILNYEVKKDIIVNYNIAINPVIKTVQLPTFALIKTRATLDGNPFNALETGTPILSQLFICNEVVFRNVEPNRNHVLKIQWYRETYPNAVGLDDADVFLRRCEVTVRAYESAR